MSVREFLYMDGYGFYIWTSYALALIVLSVNVIAPMLRRKRLFREIAGAIRRGKMKDVPQT